MKTPMIYKLAMTAFAVLMLNFSALAQCEDHKALLDILDKAMAEKNTERLKEVYHADAVRHLYNEDLTGIDKIIEDAKEFYKNVPDAVNTTNDMICTGDKVVSRWTGEGTPVEAGKKVKITGITIMHIKDGKIVEEWEELNMMSLMMQMGFTLTPPAGADGGGR